MRHFLLGVVAYAVLCCIVAAAIVLHGEGPAPVVTALYPRNGDLFWPGGSAQITFSHPMNEASVERALVVSPGTQGKGAWYGNTLNLQPAGDWKPDVRYHVTLTGKVMDTDGRLLHTPVAFWFRVHHVQRLGFCAVHGVRNVCEVTPGYRHVLTRAPTPVLDYALSDDGVTLAYTRRDVSGLPHLYLIDVDGANAVQLTGGRGYADSHPSWTRGDQTQVTYVRRPVRWQGSRPLPGKTQVWSIGIDGSNNSPL